MAFIVVATSAFGAYQDSVGSSATNVHDIKNAKAKVVPVSKLSKELVGASGAGTSHKQSQNYLDVSERADGPHVKDGPNTYRGKAGGYDLRDTYDSDDESVDSVDSDGEDASGAPMSEFQRKIKYIKNIFKEIFSKWGSNGSVLAPTSVEEQVDNPMGPEGFRIREKFRRGARQGMRKLKNAFRGRTSSGNK